jgi:hypothetical protein
MDQAPLNKLKFHLARLLEDPAEHDWQRVVETLDELALTAPDERSAAVRRHLAKCEPQLRAHRLPGDAALLLQELKAATQRRTGPAPEPSVEERVAAALRGRALLVIGGVPKPESKKRLREAFGLSELLWPVTREDTPDGAKLEPQIARSDVAAVALLIRWVRHELNYSIDELCKRHKKPMARVPGGYNPAQIAAALHEQCGVRLGI